MNWLTFKNAVLLDLPVDNERIGIATGNPNYLQQQLLYAILQIQKLIPFYQSPHETIYGADDMVVEGFASVGSLPSTQQCKPLDAYFKKVGRQCVSQPLTIYDWGNRYDLICGNPRIIGCQFLITYDPWGRQFTVFPSVGNVHQISLFWAGVKTVFLDTDETPFDFDVSECVGLFVKAKIARMVDHDLAEYGSYMSEYVGARRLLYADARERNRMRHTQDSPVAGGRCANSLRTCQDIGGSCENPDREHEDTIEFCAFGDSGETPLDNTYAVSILVKSLEPDFVMHMGDAVYPNGDPILIQDELLKFYGLYVPQDFYLAFGNHDIEVDGGAALRALLTQQASYNAGLTYYDFIPGRPGKQWAHIFVLDTNGDPAVQGPWLQSRLAGSSMWNIVVMHKPPYCSDIDHYPGEVAWRLPFKEWGAHIVLCGHGHNYERIQVDGFPYIICGLGGAAKRGFHSPPVTGSQFRYNDFYGSLYVTAKEHRLQETFYNTPGEVIDSLSVETVAVAQVP